MDFSTFYQEKIAPLYDSYFDYNLYESLAKKKYELLAMVATIIAICVGVWAHFIFSVKTFENIYLHYFLKLSKYVLPKF